MRSGQISCKQRFLITKKNTQIWIQGVGYSVNDVTIPKTECCSENIVGKNEDEQLKKQKKTANNTDTILLLKRMVRRKATHENCTVSDSFTPIKQTLLPLLPSTYYHYHQAELSALPPSSYLYCKAELSFPSNRVIYYKNGGGRGGDGSVRN